MRGTGYGDGKGVGVKNEETLDELRKYGLKTIQPRDGYRFSLTRFCCVILQLLALGRKLSTLVPGVGSSR